MQMGRETSKTPLKARFSFESIYRPELARPQEQCRQAGEDERSPYDLLHRLFAFFFRDLQLFLPQYENKTLRMI